MSRSLPDVSSKASSLRPLVFNTSVVGNANEFTEIAEKVSSLKQQQSTLIPNTESAVVPTGETFRDLIESDPRRVVKQAIEILVLSPPLKRGAKGKFQDRVTICWRDEPEHDTD